MRAAALLLLGACCTPTVFKAERLEIDVDWVAGYAPDEVALYGLYMIAQRERAACAVSIVRGREIPADRWRDETNAAPRPGVEIRVLYCPENPFGPDGASNGLCRRREKPFPHWQIFIFKGTLNRYAVGPLSPGVIDRSCLIHEFGHALGLVANPAHRFESHGGHCTNPACVMTQPNLKAVLANAADVVRTGETPWDFCDDCRADLESLREP